MHSSGSSLSAAILCCSIILCALLVNCTEVQLYYCCILIVFAGWPDIFTYLRAYSGRIGKSVQIRCSRATVTGESLISVLMLTLLRHKCKPESLSSTGWEGEMRGISNQKPGDLPGDVALDPSRMRRASRRDIYRHRLAIAGRVTPG